MTTMAEMDPAKTEAGMNMIVGNLAGGLISCMCSIGDRLGLFTDLANSGPATSADFALRNGLSERYAREWLNCLAAAGYFEHDPATDRYTLPPAYAPILAQEGHPLSAGPFFGALYAMEKAAVLGRLADAFRTGSGISQDVFGEDWQIVMERLSTPWYDHQLVQQWIAADPAMEAKLTAGAEVADVGCGAGRALVRLAEAFPKSRFTGFDLFPAALTLANAKTAAAGVADRVSFQQVDAAKGLPGAFDVVMTADVVHDAADPAGLLRSIRSVLKPDGTALVVEFNCGETLADNAGPMGAMIYAISLIYCMSTSLAAGGAALGMAGLPESKLRALALESGFGSLQRIAEDPFNAVYALRP
ncbi:MAG: class I SAM-dependent methyltransferase [Tepidiformaceae bacterium]